MEIGCARKKRSNLQVGKFTTTASEKRAKVGDSRSLRVAAAAHMGTCGPRMKIGSPPPLRHACTTPCPTCLLRVSSAACSAAGVEACCSSLALSSRVRTVSSWRRSRRVSPPPPPPPHTPRPSPLPACSRRDGFRGCRRRRVRPSRGSSRRRLGFRCPRRSSRSTSTI